MLNDYLQEYLRITQEMLKIKDFSSMDDFDLLLKKRASIQVLIDNEAKQEIDENMKKTIKIIKEAESQLNQRIKNEMIEIEKSLNKVKKDRMTHGRNKLAFKKFAGSNVGGTGYYFDRKK